jgi:MFS family permease
MYSVYSLPNMFIPLIGGALIDSMNPIHVLIGFSTIVCLGQTLFAIGVTTKWFSLMLFGRILFGIGGESISVAQASITTRWFSGKELSFALGLSISIF